MSLIFLAFLSLSFFSINLSENNYLKAIFWFILIFISLIYLFNNKIVLEKYFIRIYFGIFIINIKYKDIKGLYITDNNLISLSSSCHRVGIKTNNWKTIIFDKFISPMDREDFIFEVNNRI